MMVQCYSCFFVVWCKVCDKAFSYVSNSEIKVERLLYFRPFTKHQLPKETKKNSGSLTPEKMTVSYQYDVASSTSGGFTRLLFKWKGSLYKLVWRELLLFCVGYSVMSAAYRQIFSEEQKRTFEQVVIYCDTLMNYIPLSFILGFYVSFVASRWWQQYLAIPWPDKILHSIALYVSGYDQQGRMMRRAMVRYLNLSLVLVLRSISSAVKKRFPTLDHLVEAGFLTSTELAIYSLVPNKEFNTYWIPCTWFTALLKEARYQKRIADPVGMKLIMEEFSEFRQKCGMLWSYDWVSIPLVYTQVVTIATYAFFLACIVGRQYVEKPTMSYKSKLDMYIPFFTILQFFFYMGLLKVAEQLINPFGDDDEDFELNWIIDRHIKVSYLIVDTLLLRTPPLSKDIFFDEESPELPYTEASATFKKRTYRGSVANMVIPEDKQHLILPNIVEEVEESESDQENSLRESRISMRGSSQHLIPGGKDSRSQGGTEDNDTGSGSPVDPRKSNSIPNTTTATSSRITRNVTAGSKGVGSALLAVGSHQVIIASEAEKLNEASTVITIDDMEQQEQTENPLKNEDELQYIVLPFSSKTLNVTAISVDDESCINKGGKLRTKSSFKVPASFKAKLAVKKKPVITWKPYQRPKTLHVLSDENSVNTDNGCFEEECAFMWRTIEDDSESTKTANSAGSDEPKSDIPDADAQVFSHYRDIKPQHVGSFSKLSPVRDKSSARQTTAMRRARYKLHSRASCRSCSTPCLSQSSPLTQRSLLYEDRTISQQFLRSISETLLFNEVPSQPPHPQKYREDCSLPNPNPVSLSLPSFTTGMKKRKPQPSSATISCDDFERIKIPKIS